MKLSEIQLVSEIEAWFSENNEYDAIKADIASRGIQDPVKVNKDNQLLAGYTRVKIAQELGFDEVPHVVVDVDGDMDTMLEYAILDNIRRRQLSDLQLVEYGMKLEKLYEGRQGRPEKGGQDDHVFEGKTRDLVADKIKEQTGAKMSGKKYDRLRTIATQAVLGIKQQFNNGEITQKDALQFAKLPSDEQRKIVKLSDETNISLRRAKSEIARKKSEEALTKIPPSLEPPSTGGRKTTAIRWVHRETGEVIYELRIGPNVTSAQLASWRGQKQEDDKYQQRQDEIKTLQKQAEDLRGEAQQLEAGAHELERLAREKETEMNLDIRYEIEFERGPIEPFVENYDIEVLDKELRVQLSKLGKAEANQVADLLLAAWGPEKLEIKKYGVWGDMNLLSVKSSGLKNAGVTGWTGIGGMDGLCPIEDEQ